MFRKTKKVVFNYIIPSLRDRRFLGLMTLTVLVLLTSWSGVRIVEVNYALQQEIAGLAAKNQVRQLENENLKLKNQYLNTDTYLELTARQQFGKGGKDEKLILIPKDVALATVPKLTEKQTAKAIAAASQPFYVQNLQAWHDFFLHSNQ